MRTVASGLPHKSDPGLLLYHVLLEKYTQFNQVRVTSVQIYMCKI